MLPTVAQFLRSHLDDDYDPRDADSGPHEAVTPSYNDPTDQGTLSTPLPPQEPSYQDPTTLTYPPAPTEPPNMVIQPSGTPPTPNGDWQPVRTIPNPQTQAANPRMTYGRPFIPGMEEGPADPAPPQSGPPSMGDLLIQSRGGAPELADRSTEAQQRAVQQAAGGPVAPRQAPVYRQEPAEDAAAQIERQPAYEQPRGIPTLPGSSGRMLSEAARESNKTGQPIGPLSIYSAFSELPFDVYQAAHDRAVIAADRGLEGTDPLAPFRGLGIPLPSAEEINPEGRPASVVLSGMLLAGVIPDPSDPYVAAAFKGAGKVFRAVGGVPTVAGAAIGAADAWQQGEGWPGIASEAALGASVVGTGRAVGRAGARVAGRAVEGAGRRVGAAIADNAERVATADARIARQGSTVAPGTLGVISNNDPAQAMRGRVVPPEVADTLDFPVRIPEDPAAVRAIEAIGGTIDPERGVTMNVIRNQGPNAHGGAASRGSVFYIAGKPGDPNPFAATVNDPNRVGGTERIEGKTRFRSPMFISDAPGSPKGFGEAMEQMGMQEHPDVIKAQSNLSTVGILHRQAVDARNAAFDRWKTANPGRPVDEWVNTPDAQYFIGEVQKATEELNDASVSLRNLQTKYPVTTADGIDSAVREARRAGPNGSPARAEALKEVVRRFGGTPEEIDDLLRIRGDEQAESMWAIRENILAAHARRNGYDGVVTVFKEEPDYLDVVNHPDSMAAQKAANLAEGRLAAVGTGVYDKNPAKTPEQQQALQEFWAAREHLAATRKRLESELATSKITELADVREARNPTPGEPNPRLAEAQQALRSAQADQQAFFEELKAKYGSAIGRTPEDFSTLQRLYDAIDEAESAVNRVASGPDSFATPPGYTLREDIPRRQPASTTASGTTGISRAGASALTDVSNSIGGGVFGATTGYALPADSEEQRRQNALTGAAVGMVAGPAAGRMMGRAGGALVAPGVGPNGRRLKMRELPEGAQAIKATDAAEVSRLRLDKFPEEVRDLIAAGAKEQDWARVQRRGVMPDDVVQARSMDDAASVDQIIKKGRTGRAYNAEETVAIRNAVASQSETVRSLTDEIADARSNGMTPDLLIARRAAEATRLNGLIQVAEGARAEAGRTLRQYRQQAKLIELNPNQAVEQIYKKLGGRENAGAAVDEYTKMVKDGANPIQLAKFWAKVESGKITGSDLFALYRRFNILSGPRTIEVNALSGLVNLGYEVVGAGIGQAARGRFGDAASEVIAPLKASKRAFQNMAETMWHGVSEEQALRGDIPRNLSSRTDNKAAKAALTVLEGPDRFNSGVDQFFRTMTEDWAATRLANKQARAAGLSPRSSGWSEAVAKNLETIRDDVSKFPEIKQMADRVTFSEEPGGIVKWLEEGKRKYPNIVGFVMPFIRTPANIASRAVDLSPIGPVRNAIEAGTGLGRGREMLPERLRDNAIGIGATLWAYDEATKGNITGAGPDDPEKLAELRATGWQPYSIRFKPPWSDKPEYWSYANFAPFSLALSTGAAAHEAQKYAKDGKTDTLSMLADGAARTGKVVTDMTVIAGIGAVIKSWQDPERYGGRWLSQSLQQLMPAGSLVNTIGQATDDVQRRAERDTFANQVTGDLKSRVPGLRQTVPAAQDPLGQPVPNEQTGFGALNPFRPTTERPNETIQQFIDAGVDIGAPKDKLTVRAGTAPIELTPAEQRRWNELRGEQLTAMSPRLNASPGYQAANKVGRETVMKRVLNQASETADRLLIGEIGTPEIGRRMRESAAKKAS